MARKIPDSKLKRFIEQSGSMKSDPDYPIFEAGIREGYDQLRKKALGFLQDKYLAPDAPDRDSPEAQAILKLANELSNFLK